MEVKEEPLFLEESSDKMHFDSRENFCFDVNLQNDIKEEEEEEVDTVLLKNEIIVEALPILPNESLGLCAEEYSGHGATAFSGFSNATLENDGKKLEITGTNDSRALAININHPSHTVKHVYSPEARESIRFEIHENVTTGALYFSKHTAVLKDRRKKLHKCKFCEKKFSALQSLKRHLLIHEGKRPYKCEICEKCFNDVSHLRRHVLIHAGTKPHQCEHCKKSFGQMSHLKRHILIHYGVKLHKCEICGKSFAQLSILKTHQLIHEGKRPHECEICGRHFTQRSALKRHKLIHEGKRFHKCDICEKRFTRSSTLKNHYLLHKRNM